MFSQSSEPLAVKEVLDHGHIALMGVYGNDITPVVAARTSFRDAAFDFSDKANHTLSDYLMRHHHDGPFEFPVLTFHMKMPIFVARQIIRHRIGISINEESLRYVAPCDDFYVPEILRMRQQAKNNKQGSANELVDDPEAVQAAIIECNNHALETYKKLAEKHKLAKELARTVLPLALYTSWYWQPNLRALFHFLKLRADSHAQYECRVYAEAMLEMVRPYYPNLIRCFENHVLHSVTFSQDEMGFLNQMIRLAALECPARFGEIVDEANKGLRSTRFTELMAKIDHSC